MPFSFDTVPVAKPSKRKTLATRHRSAALMKHTARSDDPFNYPISENWSKPFAARVRAARFNKRWDEAHLATIEAIIRRLVRRGWVRSHTSIYRDRASSRYLQPVADRNYRIRISDHVLHHRNRWENQYLITDQIIQTYDVPGIIAWIEKDYREYGVF